MNADSLCILKGSKLYLKPGNMVFLTFSKQIFKKNLTHSNYTASIQMAISCRNSLIHLTMRVRIKLSSNPRANTNSLSFRVFFFMVLLS